MSGDFDNFTMALEQDNTDDEDDGKDNDDDGDDGEDNDDDVEQVQWEEGLYRRDR